MHRKHICDSTHLAEKGDGIRFTVRRGNQSIPAFAVRYEGRVYAYLNQCAHRDVELDWEEGKFFDADQRYLICATHGALYEPTTGVCVDGPCRRGGLHAIEVEEGQQQVFIVES